MLRRYRYEASGLSHDLRRRLPRYLSADFDRQPRAEFQNLTQRSLDFQIGSPGPQCRRIRGVPIAASARGPIVFTFIDHWRRLGLAAASFLTVATADHARSENTSCAGEVIASGTARTVI